MTVTPELETAITALYSAFETRTLSEPMRGCHCCTNDAELRHLSFTPLRELSADDLSSYTWDAIWTVGNENDFRYFTPRLLELMARENRFQDEVVAKKLVVAGWRKWPAKEQVAVTCFFKAYWTAVLTSEATWCVAEDAVCILGNVFDDLSPFLERWAKAPELTAIEQLVLYARMEAGAACHDYLSQPFWSDRPEQMKQVARWLCSQATLDLLQNRWFAQSDGPVAKALDETVKWVETAVRTARIEEEQRNQKLK